MAADPREIHLTDEQRKLLAKRSEETGRPWSELLKEVFAKIPLPRSSETKGRTLYDALNDRGIIGSITDAPSDLSTNPKHMEGFGTDAQ